MKKVYYLSTCDTCKRIMSGVPQIKSFEQIDIKIQPITEADLDKAKEVAGSYEQLFSKRARKFKSEGYKEQRLTEADYKKLILQEYTFLKRPVFFIDNEVFIGNSKKEVARLYEYMT